VKRGLLVIRHRVFLGLAWSLAMSLATLAGADPPALAYLFPAGARRGSQVVVRVGGLNLYDRPGFEALAEGVRVPAELKRMPTIWFEGPLIKQPASQQKEDYPQDYHAEFQIAPDALLGLGWCRARTAQGITNAQLFVVGDLPEVTEEEIDGEPLTVEVQQPLTINGRIFPREDIDLWSFNADAGRPITLRLATGEIGSPLEPLMEVLDASGHKIAEATSRMGRDPQVRFTPTTKGRLTARIRDIRGSGLQNHVYRLTITDGPWIDSVFPLGGKRGKEMDLSVVGQVIPSNRIRIETPDRAPGIRTEYFSLGDQPLNAVLFDVDDLPESIETTSSSYQPPVAVPCVLNGRIAAPGEIDRWTFSARKGEALRFEVRAARLGSPLDAMLVIKSSAGKELLRGDDLPNGSTDCEVVFSPAENGNYVTELSERFASRGGPHFAYRLRVTHDQPGLEATYDIDSLLIDVGAEKKVPIKIQRRGGLAGPITLHVEQLPAGVTAEDVTIPPNQIQGQLTFKCTANTPVSFARVRVVAQGEHQGRPYSCLAHRATLFADMNDESLPLAVTLPAPFKYKGSYELKYTPRGASLRKVFQIERGNFLGSLRVQLAERQGRHLQGVTGPLLDVPAGMSEFEYPLNLPPWMELGRTSRTNLMMIGEVQDAAGKTQQVAYSTNEQNEQLIAIVSPSLVKLIPEPANLVAKPGQTLELNVQLRRDPSLREAIQLRLIVPPQTSGVTAAPVSVAAGGDAATMPIAFAEDCGPFNAPLIIRGVAETANGPIVAESCLTVTATGAK
jgi:hypothetical protein